ncbi:hypothetical protein GCM10012275_33090 [Longimycelium tulufanense]|uniref:Uncharacterized protein n=1 Tax=Longimycelium tulufanense TaxID=907463 RepID=A0A8J3CGX1_9PSEU|nr:hypothetical protein [Longimycelium tulufanense]GGM59297.1 hypothetical protein GCM10012275_33090 [Longimycelium tulufanense]
MQGISWRIDYVAATAGIAEKAVSCAAERAESYDARWPDHAPLTITFDWVRCT